MKWNNDAMRHQKAKAMHNSIQYISQYLQNNLMKMSPPHPHNNMYKNSTDLQKNTWGIPKTCVCPCALQIENPAYMCRRLIASRLGWLFLFIFLVGFCSVGQIKFVKANLQLQRPLFPRRPHGCSTVIRQCHRQVNVIVKPKPVWSVPTISLTH